VAQQAIAGNDNQIKSVVNRMTAAVHDFVGDAEQSDDLTMLAIGYQGVKNEA
jgi:sigma-B regulation protein RsbU (phosphoserine phosphatase)